MSPPPKNISLKPVYDFRPIYYIDTANQILVLRLFFPAKQTQSAKTKQYNRRRFGNAGYRQVTDLRVFTARHSAACALSEVNDKVGQVVTKIGCGETQPSREVVRGLSVVRTCPNVDTLAEPINVGKHGAGGGVNGVVVDRGVQSAGIEPVHPAGGRGFDLLRAGPGPLMPVDQLCLVQADGRFHEGVVQGIPDRTDRRRDPGIDQRGG